MKDLPIAVDRFSWRLNSLLDKNRGLYMVVLKVTNPSTEMIKAFLFEGGTFPTDSQRNEVTYEKSDDRK